MGSGDEDRSCDSQKRIERQALRVVRDFRRAEDAGRHREEIRLEDRPGYDVRRGPSLPGLDARHRRGQIVDPAAAIAVDREKREAVRQRGRNGLAGADQPLRGLAQRGANLGLLVGGREKQLDRRRAQRLGQRIEHEQRVGIDQIEQGLDERVAI